MTVKAHGVPDPQHLDAFSVDHLAQLALRHPVVQGDLGHG
jgi:hypothetical protein